MGFLFQALTRLAGFGANLFLALCISAGLYVACEMAEDCSSFMKKLLKWYIGGTLAVYSMLYLDGAIYSFPIYLGTSVCILCYVPLLETFPVVDIMSSKVMLAILVTGINHYLWHLNFAHPETAYFASLLDLVGFFIYLVWGIPALFGISLTSSTDCLPGFDNNDMKQQHKQNKPVGVLKSLMDYFLVRKDEALHRVAPGMGKYV
mmetsp:Transcript_13328/g.24154  ORF Transcript_13328/g.24154 Transcript_13328/m.24154 type:complete len:205 (-) Transcript_13328:375-989(-)